VAGASRRPGQDRMKELFMQAADWLSSKSTVLRVKVRVVERRMLV
jgi:hypothetical protein